jgi:SHAQKYF class myb-like DNA-binding protein
MLFDPKLTQINLNLNLQFNDDEFSNIPNRFSFNSSNNFFNITIKDENTNTIFLEEPVKEKNNEKKSKLKLTNKTNKPNSNKIKTTNKEEGKKLKKQKTKDNNFNNGRWTEEEHKKFIQSILLYGNEWRNVEKFIGTRSSTQARSHAQKFFEKMKLANLVDEEVDLNNKTSIKQFQETLRHMDKEHHLHTVESLSGLPIEMKKTKKDRPDDSKCDELNSTSETKPNLALTKKIEDITVTVSSTGPDNLTKQDNKIFHKQQNINKFSRRKRTRNLSTNSIDFSKIVTNYYYQEEVVEMEILDEKADINIFNMKKIKEEDIDLASYYCKSYIDPNYKLNCESSISSKSIDELFDPNNTNH